MTDQSYVKSVAVVFELIEFRLERTREFHERGKSSLVGVINSSVVSSRRKSEAVAKMSQVVNQTTVRLYFGF